MTLVLRLPQGSTLIPRRGDQLSVNVYLEINTSHVLLLPAQASVNGHVLVKTPRILRKDRVVVGLSREVQVPELSTDLEETDAYAAIGAVRLAGDSHFGHATVRGSGAQVEFGGGAVGNQLRLQARIYRRQLSVPSRAVISAAVKWIGAPV